MIRLLRNKANNAIVQWEPGKNGDPKYEELNEEEVHGYFGYAASKSGRTVSFDPEADGITLYTTSMGIGDAVCVLYAACGLASRYKVTYNARHYRWLQWVSHPNLTLKPLSPKEELGGVDVNQEYMDQLWEGFMGRLESRPHWALRAVRKQYPTVPDDIQPCRPAHVIRPDPVMTGEYILISPYSSCVGPARDWPAPSYARLISLLAAEGLKSIVAITSEHKDDVYMYETVGAKVLVDSPADEVCALIANATLVIGNDSGMAHMGGLFGTPTFAIMAHIHPSTTFLCGDSIQGIVPSPKIPCRFCSWQKEGGHLRACQAFCAALSTITPWEVAIDVLFRLRKTGSIGKSSQES